MSGYIYVTGRLVTSEGAPVAGRTVTATPYPAIFDDGSDESYSQQADSTTGADGTFRLQMAFAADLSYLIECRGYLRSRLLSCTGRAAGDMVKAMSLTVAPANALDPLTDTDKVTLAEALAQIDSKVASAVAASGNIQSFVAAQISDATTTGRALLTASDAAAARSTLALGGAATLGVGTVAGTVAAGNDSRLANARTPTAHAATHATGGADALTLAAAQISDLTEYVQDAVAAFVRAGSNVSVTYDDAGNTFTINSTATGGGGTTDPEVVRDTIGGALVPGSGVQITVNDAGDTITIASTAVLPTRKVTAGVGLTGGGDLSTDRTLAVNFGTTAGTVTAGDDSRLSDARTPTSHSHPASQISDATATGRALVTAADAASGRSALSLGNAATRSVGTAAGTVAAGDDARITQSVQATLVDAKGDLLAGAANDTIARVPVGANGHVLTADATAAAGVGWRPLAAPVSVTTFAATGAFVEYVIPSGATMLELVLIGGGGGGGSGRRGAAGTARCGGGGGASGAVTRVTLDAAALTAAGVASLWCRSDIGGGGGAAVTTDSTDGNAGAVGGISYVCKSASTANAEILAYAGGGGGGGGGTAAAGAAGTPGYANYGTSAGSAGGAASPNAAGANGATGTAGGAPSGGAGGSLSTANAASGGGNGGDARPLYPGSGGTGGTGAGGNGAAVLGGWANPGGGGAGGGASASGAGPAGGNGGGYGSGGGGGAASINGSASGAGGAGGPGVIRITAW